MESPIRPNLFTYATSELSQDAFICWLAKWADPKYANMDEALHKAGQAFVVSMIRKDAYNNSFNKEEIKTINVVRQKYNIDVLIEINKSFKNQFAILIEDKTHTDHSKNPLSEYVETINKQYEYETSQITALLFKTGHQSLYENTKSYRIYDRHDFLLVLKEQRDEVKNNIFLDFLNHLQYIDDSVNKYLDKNANTKLAEEEGGWGGNDWQGFFLRIYPHFSKDGANWRYVPNQSGGFWGFWWHFKTVNINNHDCKVYIQLENQTLRFRIEFGANMKLSDKIEARNVINSCLSELIIDHLVLPKPRYTKISEKTRTVGLIKIDEYRVSHKNSCINFDETLNYLKSLESLLDLAIHKINLSNT